MLVRCHHDPREFFDLVEPFLLDREAENALPLGIARSFVETATHDGLMFSVESGAAVASGSAVVAVAVKTPHRNLIVTGGPECAMRALATYLDAYGLPVPGITGPSESVKAFCAAWTALTGRACEERMRMRLFALSPKAAARDPHLTAPGTFRLAADGDADVVERWLHAFVDEATHERHDDVHARVLQMIGSRSVGLWDDGGPASMAAVTRRSARGAHVAWVYTPPERRGHGYASACVAELSRRELGAGRQFCTLYADTDNPASKALYERLGYAPISDAVDAVFLEPPA